MIKVVCFYKIDQLINLVDLGRQENYKYKESFLAYCVGTGISAVQKELHKTQFISVSCNLYICRIYKFLIGLIFNF